MAAPVQRTPPEPPRGIPVAWIAVAVLLLVVGGASAYFFLLGEKPEETPKEQGGTADTTSYRPATHMDPARSSLKSDEQGKSVAEVLLKDVSGEARPTIKVRATAFERSLAVFVLRAPDASKIGVVEATFTPAGPDEVVARIPLGKPVDHVTVYDVRWDGPREGFEMGTRPAPK